MENTLQKHREIRENEKKECGDFFGPLFLYSYPIFLYTITAAAFRKAIEDKEAY